MRKTILALLIVIVSVIGIIDAMYITYEKIAGRVPPCTAGFACGAVLNSQYASVGLVPLSALGLVFYITFLVVGSWYVLKLESDDWQSQTRLRWIMMGLGVLGFGFSLYLLFIMGVILQAWCFYCLLSALNCVVLFCTSLAIYLTGRKS